MTQRVAVRLAARWLERALFVMGGVLALWCTFNVARAPFEFIGHAPRRFIVRADLVSENARQGPGEAGGPGSPGP